MWNSLKESNKILDRIATETRVFCFVHLSYIRFFLDSINISSCGTFLLFLGRKIGRNFSTMSKDCRKPYFFLFIWLVDFSKGELALLPQPNAILIFFFVTLFNFFLKIFQCKQFQDILSNVVRLSYTLEWYFQVFETNPGIVNFFFIRGTEEINEGTELCQ